MISKLAGLCLLVSSLAIVYFFEHSGSGSFRLLHWPAMILTGIGPFGLVMLCSEWSRVKGSFRYLFRKSPTRLQQQFEREADLLLRISQSFYSQGAQALSSFDSPDVSPQLRKAISRLSMKVPVPDVVGLLRRERDRVDARYSELQGVLSLGLRLAPSLGMLGTILGMVQLLSNLKDPSEIGSNIGLALLTTFYGLFFSLLLWTPLNHRMETYRDVEIQSYEQLLLWLDLIDKRKPVQYFESERTLDA
jgi:chemotaxis protein MotA